MWDMLPLAGCVGLELGRLALGHATKPQWLFYIDARNFWSVALLLLGTVMAIAVPIKIWNNTRIQMNLEQHQQLLLKARMDALSSQINPHFLFNTLNTVSSLIRYDPDLARGRRPQAEQYPSPPAAQARNVRAAAGGARLCRRLPGHRGRSLRPR